MSSLKPPLENQDICIYGVFRKRGVCVRLILIYEYVLNAIYINICRHVVFSLRERMHIAKVTNHFRLLVFYNVILGATV